MIKCKCVGTENRCEIRAEGNVSEILRELVIISGEVLNTCSCGSEKAYNECKGSFINCLKEIDFKHVQGLERIDIT